MTSDVLFGQAYYLSFDPKLLAAGQPYAPLGTLYAAATARAAGYSVSLFDAMLASSTDEWAGALDRHRPRVAVIYEDSFNYLSKMCLLRMRDAAMAMIDAARARRIPVVVSGSDASDHPALYLRRGAALVIAGEAELTLVEVLHVLIGQSAQPIASVQGVRYLESGGDVRGTAPRELIRDLDQLPGPAWDLVDVERYRTLWQRRHGMFSMNVVTTRGCPYHCNWCAKPIYGQRYAARSPGHVADELAWLKRTYRPDHIWMADDIFGLKPGWIDQFAAAVAARDARIPFKCLLRADGVSPRTARDLARAGCRTAWLGAESGSQAILDAMEKGTRVDQIMSATRHLRAEGIDVGFFLQFGYPGEMLEDVERTLQMVRDCDPDDIGISVSYPLPGTPFFERVKAELGIKRNWTDSDDLAMLFRAPYVPEFYRTLHALTHAEFRARRSAKRVLGRTRPGALPAGAKLARDVASGLWHAARLPLLRHRLARLSRLPTDAPPTLVVPVLSRQAASTPSEQPR